MNYGLCPRPAPRPASAAAAPAAYVPPARRNGGPAPASNVHHAWAQPQVQHQPLAQSIPGLTLLQDMTQGTRPGATAGPPPKAASPSAKKGKKRNAATANKALANGPRPSTTTRPRRSPAPRLGKDERQPPSRESGGIPEPAPLYLAQSLAPPVALPHPRRILVILDLNGTLLYRPTHRQPTKFVERPHASRFLTYCLDAFHLAIWSSARPDNVQRMLAQLLTPEQCQRCVVVWGRDRFGLSQNDYNSRVQCYKRLSALWDDPQVRASHPAAQQGGCWDQSNTVLVDDSPEKGRSEPHNILPVPEFCGAEKEAIDVLPQVHDYLNNLCYQDDISKYMRRNPFYLDPIYHLSPLPAQEA